MPQSVHVPHSPQVPQDGYIKFRCEHTATEWESNTLPLPADLSDLLQKLDIFRTKVYDQNFIGIYKNGIGYGNLSHRWNDKFVITASGTGGSRELGIDGYTLVTAVDIAKNTVNSLGPLPASSETMSHASVYVNSPKVECILHIHNKTLFDMLKEKNALSTAEDIAYGTVEMALALEKLVQKNQSEAVICMRGHEEGILLYGMSIAHVQNQLAFLCEEAYQELVQKKNAAKKCRKNNAETKCNQCPKGEHHD